MGKILYNINSPEDVKKLTFPELYTLCDEIRSFLIDSISETGGHLASNLGAVELTVALHKVFSVPEDKMVFDVGHQSYTHKILTGRRDMFPTLRQFGGLAGFPKRSESDCDCFNTGHSSTSVSAALGLARARDLNGTNENIVAVFGDGALTGGMLFEAMNDAGHTKTPLILILNDNHMSIAANVGSISKHLRRLRVSPHYFKSKQRIENFLETLPAGGKQTAGFIRKIKRAIRRRIIPTTIFEDLGFMYIGPVDGHDLESLTACMEYASHEKKPTFIHVLTTKGKGYYPAETDPEKFHGISPFNKITGKPRPSGESFSAHFGKTLVSLAEKNDRIVAITAAMPSGTGLCEFAKHFKDRFFDVGIAEQHAVTMAAGMAAGGYIPVVPLYSSFMQRAYDQILHDVCLQRLHVVFVADRAGIVGADGETHQGIYDIAFLSHMPNMTILSPATFTQLEEMLDYAINKMDCPVAIRYPRGGENIALTLPPFDINRAVTLQKGNDVSIITAGRMAKRALEVSEGLQEHNMTSEVLLLPTIHPFDDAAVIAAAMKTGYVVTIEDGVKSGGMGQSIAAFLKEKNVECRVSCFAFGDEPVPHGSIDALDKLFGLDKDSVIKEVLNGKSKT